MKKPKDRYIKHVELITPDEFKKHKVFQSMIRTFGEYNDTSAHDINMRVVVSTNNGDIKTMEIEDLVCNKKDWFNAFSEERCFCAVKMLWSDGKWEYGIKFRKSKDRICRKNGLLNPVYTKIGEVDENGVFVGALSNEDCCREPAWILNMIPMWNERIRDALNVNDRTVETRLFSLEDWRDVQRTLNSGYATNHAHIENIKIDGKQVKMPVNIVFDRNKHLSPVFIEWKKGVFDKEFGSKSIYEATHMKVVCYSYLKSIYCNKVKRVKEYKVIPLSDVIMLTKRRWDNNTQKYVEDEVWNSLDETCKGNV